MIDQFERATKELPVYDIPFFDVSYVKQDNRNMISLKGKNKLLPLSVSSSGLQSAIPMLVIIDYAIKTDAFNSFVIEEPEQNLFPENQREILNFISSRMAGKDDRQVVLTTHSPYMLSCLNVLMLAYKMHNHGEFREKVEEIVNKQSNTTVQGMTWMSCRHCSTFPTILPTSSTKPPIMQSLTSRNGMGSMQTAL